jgi:di- and tripeptidase
LTGFFDTSSGLLRPSNEQLVQSLTRFVSFRTVSSKPEYAEDCRQGASWLRNLFKQFGAQTELLKTDYGQNPIVYACFKGKSSSGKRILFYGHYDVVSAENDQGKWKSDPFSLQGQDGYLYGRGVSDNKGPVLAAVYAVADLVTEKKLETDVVFLVEGEEERGSRGFDRAVKSNKHIIGDISWILLANSYWLNNDFPCLTYGLRGVIHATISVEGGRKDLHSGVNGSNLMNEPLKDLVALVATITDTDRRINIPGFYDNIRPFSKEEEQWYSDISNTISRTTSTFQDPESLKAKWREPSFTIHGFTTSSSGVSTVIPHKATVKISFRLVPNQGAEEISKSFVEYIQSEFRKLKTLNALSVKLGHPVDPWLGDPNNEIYKSLEEAIIDVWKLNSNGTTHAPKLESVREEKYNVDGSSPLLPRKPLYIREGGSIPAIRFLEKELDAPAAQLPCGQASDNAHLENERLRLTNLYNSREIFKKVFRELPTR